MADPRTTAMQTLGSLLAKAGRTGCSAGECQQMVELVAVVPGWIKRVAHALSAQRSAPGVEGLRRLPPGVPGVVEGLHHAFASGVTRVRLDGSAAPAMLAVDFRRSRARTFADILARAQAVFGEGFETFRIGTELRYRFGLQATRGTLAGQAAAASVDLGWLHARLAKLKGTRLWLNGWPFDPHGPFSGNIQVHLLRAWLSWASTQTTTRA